MKQSFDITGMTCAACSARVEKAAAKVGGVESVSVNLLKNTMQIEFNGDQETLDAVIASVKKAGYGAYPHGVYQRLKNKPAANKSNTQSNTFSSLDSSFNAAEAETKKIRMRLIVSLVFTIPLFYLSMGHMFNWPLPSIFLGHENMMTFGLTQLLLLTPVIFVNFKFFRNGFSSLFRGAPNMDSLVALGSSASTIYGIAALYRIGTALGGGNLDNAHAAAMDLYFESAAMILTLITLGKFFEARAKGKTTDALSKLMDLAPKTTFRIKDGIFEEISVDEVCVGDVLQIMPGMTVPVDGAIISGYGVVDESAITGESTPVEKSDNSTVVAGSISVGTYFMMMAYYVGEDTTLAKIIRLVDEATSSKAPIEKLADKISGIFVPAVIAIAAVTFIIWMFASGNVATALNHAISVLVISCPCALGLATPTAIMVGTGRGATRGILIKSAESLETAHALKTVVFDKTGTLTQGSPKVTDCILEKDALDIAFSLEKMSNHPLAKAIVTFAEVQNAKNLDVDDIEQIPGGGLKAKINGDICIAGNASLMSKNGIDVSEYNKQANKMANDGKTVLYFTHNNKLLGILALADQAKPTSAAAIDALRKQGISTVMLTGDNKVTAQAVQRELNLDRVVADVLPQDKEEEIRRIAEGARGKSKKNKVAMVGDGINDAPALARADVGIAVGAGTDIAIAAADIVLTRSDLMDVVAAIDLSRSTMRNIKQNLFWALFYNVICIPIAAGIFSWLGLTLNPMIAAAAMSCSSICVVGNALRLRTWKPSCDKMKHEQESVARVDTASEDASAGQANAEQADTASEGASATQTSATNETTKLTKEDAIKDWVRKNGTNMTAWHSQDPVANEKTLKEAQAMLLAAYAAKDTRQNEQADATKQDTNDAQASFAQADGQQGKETTMEKTLQIEGMMCQHCVAHAKKALEEIDGVSSADVYLEEKKAIVQLSSDVADEILIAAIVDAGYEAKVLG